MVNVLNQSLGQKALSSAHANPAGGTIHPSHPAQAGQAGGAGYVANGATEQG